MIKKILIRWASKGGSSYDPLPTLAHHLVHILGAALFGSTLISLIPFPLSLGVVIVATVAVGLAEVSQEMNGATTSDCIFDIYQWMIMWAYPFGLDTGLVIAGIWAIGYFILLLTLLNDNGDPI